MPISSEMVHVPVDKFLKHQKLFGMFVQSNSGVKTAQTKADWNIFCTQSLKTEHQCKWYQFSEQLIQNLRKTDFQKSKRQSAVCSNPQFKSSFNVGLSLTLHALALRGVDPLIINRTHDLLHEQQAVIESRKPPTRLKSGSLHPHENSKGSSRCLIWKLPSAHTTQRRLPRTRRISTG